MYCPIWSDSPSDDEKQPMYTGDAANDLEAAESRAVRATALHDVLPTMAK